MTSYTRTEVQEAAAYGGFADALGGVATIVLAVVGLAGFRPEIMVAIATIVFGAALLIEGGAILSEYAQIILPGGTVSGSVIIANEMASGSSGMQLLAGLAAIVLGTLALAGAVPIVLTLAALLALGATLILTGSSLSATVLSLMRPSVNA
jgi:energy-coupling factor transporter transmembrane protein EcfT